MGRIEFFRKLTVWQKSHQLFLDIANDVELFPKKRVAWIIADQIFTYFQGLNNRDSELADKMWRFGIYHENGCR
jgi:hypothetical protein